MPKTLLLAGCSPCVELLLLLVKDNAAAPEPPRNLLRMRYQHATPTAAEVLLHKPLQLHLHATCT
jgi:hypothetical protein